ncbi:molecular chaperone DnaJ [Helicobacter heilmannii]|uniref:molecular chaperone DnaJ n=1 Tax=Helicobacter heilmannii TaxID=35817 RepID=UPI0006A1F653|nr:molecular chaperone DnaJ [Helicobacter heilmannii]CRF45065.1 COG0419: ATPase involved in DNA repair [Helicobacter heilmannii]
MFIQNLNPKQQEVFLYLARKVIEADGVLHELQLGALDMLKMQCKPGISEKEVPLNTLGKIFDTNYTKHATLLELVSVALADSRWHENERDTIYTYAKEMGVSTEKVEQLKEWVLKNFRLYEEALELLA